MAEVLAVAASAFGVVSLCLQLVETSMKLKSLFDSVKEVPDEIHYTLNDVENLGRLLQQIYMSIAQNPVCSQPVQMAFEWSRMQCQESTKELNLLAEDLNRDFRGGKINVLFKVNIRKSKLASYQSRVQACKSSLMLAVQCHTMLSQQDSFNEMKRDMAHIKSQITQLSIQQLSTCQISSTNSADKFDDVKTTSQTVDWGAVTERWITRKRKTSTWYLPLASVVHEQAIRVKSEDSKSTSIKDDARENCSIITLKPWLFAWKFQMRIITAANTFNFGCTTYNIIPTQSPIFKYSRSGDVKKLQRLLSTGSASIFDVDQFGYPALLHAITRGRSDVVEFMLQNGARTYLNQYFDVFSRKLTLLEWFIFMSSTLFYETRHITPFPNCYFTAVTSDVVSEDEYLKIFRLLLNVDNDDSLYTNLQSEGSIFGNYCGPPSTLKWLFQYSSSIGLRTHLKQPLWAFCIQGPGLEAWQSQYKLDYVLQCLPDQRIDAEVSLQRDVRGNTILHHVLGNCDDIYRDSHVGVERWFDMARSLVKSGADIYATSVEGDTPLVMFLRRQYVPRVYFRGNNQPYGKRHRRKLIQKWLEILKDSDINLEEYEKRELTLMNRKKAQSNCGLQNFKIDPRGWGVYEWDDSTIHDESFDLWDDNHLPPRLCEFWWHVKVKTAGDFVYEPIDWSKYEWQKNNLDMPGSWPDEDSDVNKELEDDECWYSDEDSEPEE